VDSITGAKDVNEIGRRIWRFLVCEDGPTAIEYAMMAALVIAVCVLAVDAVGSRLSESFTNSSNSITTAIGS
jgi:pilus assembly protein Flp/PilA